CLPLKNVPPGVSFQPDFRRSTPLDYPEDLLVHVMYGIRRASARNLEDERSPLAFCSGELNEAGIAAHALPRLQGKVANVPDPDVAKDRESLALHEEIVRSSNAGKSAETSPFIAVGLMPMRLKKIVHRSKVILTN